MSENELENGIRGVDVGGAGVLDETAGCHPEQATGGVRQAVILSEATGGSAVEGSLSLIHISEPTRQAEISYAVFCLKKKKEIE